MAGGAGGGGGAPLRPLSFSAPPPWARCGPGARGCPSGEWGRGGAEGERAERAGPVRREGHGPPPADLGEAPSARGERAGAVEGPPRCPQPGARPLSAAQEGQGPAEREPSPPPGLPARTFEPCRCYLPGLVDLASSPPCPEKRGDAEGHGKAC